MNLPATTADGQLAIGSVPSSPVFPIAAAPDPAVGTARAGADDAYVRSLYRSGLGRQGANAEVAGSASALASGMDVATLIADLVASPESNDQIVESLYATVLHRDRESGTSATWTDRLAANASAGDVAAGILSSPEFRTAARPAGSTSTP